MTISAATTPRAPAFILVVDDDPTARALARAALEPHLGTVAEAEDGLEAVKVLESGAFDLAVVDLDMPVMDGFGVIERARAREETRHLPIIIITGREDVVAIERAFALGATSFLCKPINWNIFRHQVAYVLNVARAEQETRVAKERAERRADVRDRALAAVARVFARRSGDATDRARLKGAIARVKRATEILSGQTPVVREADTAAGLVARAIEAVRAECGPEEAARIEISGKLELALVCDRGLAAEAMKEVLANAVRFSPHAEKVSLAVLSAAPDRLRFEISDRGPGMPEHLLAHAFEPFRSDPSEASGRLGVGLALAKAIVEAHDGRIGILSEPGSGTEVFLTFPAETSHRRYRGAVTPAPGNFASRLAEAAGAFDT
jgi:CheY-like chemotaxis protein